MFFTFRVSNSRVNLLHQVLSTKMINKHVFLMLAVHEIRIFINFCCGFIRICAGTLMHHFTRREYVANSINRTPPGKLFYLRRCDSSRNTRWVVHACDTRASTYRHYYVNCRFTYSSVSYASDTMIPHWKFADCFVEMSILLISTNY